MEIHTWTDNTPPNALNCLQLESFFSQFFSFSVYNTECDSRFPLSLFNFCSFSPFRMVSLLSSDIFFFVLVCFCFFFLFLLADVFCSMFLISLRVVVIPLAVFCWSCCSSIVSPRRIDGQFDYLCWGFYCLRLLVDNCRCQEFILSMLLFARHTSASVRRPSLPLTPLAISLQSMMLAWLLSIEGWRCRILLIDCSTLRVDIYVGGGVCFVFCFFARCCFSTEEVVEMPDFVDGTVKMIPLFFGTPSVRCRFVWFAF